VAIAHYRTCTLYEAICGANDITDDQFVDALTRNAVLNGVSVWVKAVFPAAAVPFARTSLEGCGRALSSKCGSGCHQPRLLAWEAGLFASGPDDDHPTIP
jgi:hypothetical protein